MSRGELAFWIAVAVLFGAAILTTCSSCQPKQKQKQKPDMEYVPLEERASVAIEKAKTEIIVKNIGWLQAALIIGAVFSVGAIFLGTKTVKEFAFASLVACLFGMGLVWAGVYYPQWLGLLGLIGGGGVCVYAVYVRRKAFAEVVAGAEDFRKGLTRKVTTIVDFDSAQRLHQSKATKNLVKETKKAIERKSNAR